MTVEIDTTYEFNVQMVLHWVRKVVDESKEDSPSQWAYQTEAFENLVRAIEHLDA